MFIFNSLSAREQIGLFSFFTCILAALLGTIMSRLDGGDSGEDLDSEDNKE